MVNREDLIINLTVYGNVVYCDTNAENGYIVVVENWTGSIQDFEIIANEYIVLEFPNMVHFSLTSGMLKADYTK